MNTLSARPGARPYGVLLILLGLTALVLSRDIRARSHVGDSDPGPRFLPRLMAAGMVGGGAILVIGSFLRRRGSPAVASAASDVPGEEEDSASSNIEAILLLVSLPIYLLLLPLIGFFVSTWVYSSVMMIRLRMKPLMAMLLATGMMVVVWVLFVWQFRVVLPRGPSWMPF